MGKLAYRIHLEPERRSRSRYPPPGVRDLGRRHEHAMAMAKEAIEGISGPGTRSACASGMMCGAYRCCRRGYNACRRMSRLPPLTAREVIAALKKAGYEVSSIPQSCSIS